MLVQLWKEANEKPEAFMDHTGVLRDARTGKAIENVDEGEKDEEEMREWHLASFGPHALMLDQWEVLASSMSGPSKWHLKQGEDGRKSVCPTQPSTYKAKGAHYQYQAKLSASPSTEMGGFCIDRTSTKSRSCFKVNVSLSCIVIVKRL